jgi:hypothetical protein
VLLKDRDLCGHCHRRARHEARKTDCPRCGKPGILRASTPLVRTLLAPRPATQPARSLPRLRTHHTPHWCQTMSPLLGPLPTPGAGARHQPRHGTAGASPWLAEFASYLTPRHHARHACATLTHLGHLLAEGPLRHPQALLEHAMRTEPRLARALEDFFTSTQRALPIGRGEHQAAQRRQRRVDTTPHPLRPAAAAFAEHLLTTQQRARNAGTHPRKHATIDARLTAVRDVE